MPLPPLEDLAFWIPILETGTWRDPRSADAAISLSDLMAGFMARRTDCSRRVEGAVARRIFDRAAIFIRRNVSSRHHNQGYDIVENVLCDLLEAMAQRESGIAKGLAINFEVRMRFLILDAVKRSKGWTTRRNELDEVVEGKTPAPFDDPTDAIQRSQTLASIEDARHRQMLQDHYEGLTWKEIGQLHNCDESTARKRIQGLVGIAASGVRKGRRA